MMPLNRFLVSIFLVVMIVSSTQAQDLGTDTLLNKKDIEYAIAANLDAWHKAAADTNFDAYFNLMTSDAVFIGTDAEEHWELEDFKAYSKPYFASGKAWTFAALDRHIYLDGSNVAWFDELLTTQMGVCRGSGVMKFEDGSWKVAQYVLSATIPNNKMSHVITLKAEEDARIKTDLMP